MSLNPEKDAKRRARKRQEFVEIGFRVFAERTIDAANLTDVAKAAGVATCTIYTYFNSKEELILEIGAWVWKQYNEDYYRRQEWKGRTAAEEFEYYLDSFIDLYHNHRDILRFNQFFNIYVQRERISSEIMRPYIDVINVIAKRFHMFYEKAKKDGTLRTDIPEKEMFSTTLHLMLAVVTRYAVGLVYNDDTDAEKELRTQKEMLMQRYANSGK